MPDPLSTLLSLRSPSNFAASQTPYTPNIGRNSAKTALLARSLGIPDTGETSQADMQSAYNEAAAAEDAAAREKAQLATLPAQVAGEYGVRQAQTKGQFDVEAAKARAEQQAAQLQQSQGFTASQNELNRNAMGERASAGQASQDQRQQRSIANQNALQSMPLRPKAAAPASGLWNTLFGSSAPATPSVSPEIQSFAAQIKADNPAASFDELVRSGDIDLNQFTPEQQTQLRSALGQ